MKSISKRGVKRISRERPRWTMYRVMVTGKRINTIRAIREDVQETVEVSSISWDDAMEEAVRRVRENHPGWLNLEPRPLG